MIEFAKVTYSLAGSNARVVTVQLRMNGSEGADNDAEAMDNVEVVHPLGVISQPALGAGTEAAFVRVGDECVVLALLDKSAPPLSPASGELWLYCPADATAILKFLASGTVTLAAKAGQDLVLNGGVNAVGRVGDQVQVTIPAGSFLIAASGGGTMNPSPVTVTGTITAGAPHVKA